MFLLVRGPQLPRSGNEASQIKFDPSRADAVAITLINHANAYSVASRGWELGTRFARNTLYIKSDGRSERWEYIRRIYLFAAAFPFYD